MSLSYSQRVSVTLSLEKEVKEKIKQLSKESVRSFSRCVNLVLRKHIENIEKGYEKIL